MNKLTIEEKLDQIASSVPEPLANYCRQIREELDTIRRHKYLAIESAAQSRSMLKSTQEELDHIQYSLRESEAENVSLRRRLFSDVFRTGMSIEALESFPPGNPFLHDFELMGAQIGTNCLIMYRKHHDEDQPFINICNPKTGHRVKIVIEGD